MYLHHLIESMKEVGISEKEICKAIKTTELRYALGIILDEKVEDYLKKEYDAKILPLIPSHVCWRGCSEIKEDGTLCDKNGVHRIALCNLSNEKAKDRWETLDYFLKEKKYV